MPYKGFLVPSFGGLDLRSDPQEVGISGAIDLLNVEFDRPGRVRTRDGYDNFTTVAAGRRLRFLTPYYITSGTGWLIGHAETAGAGDELVQYDVSGASVSSQDFPIAVGPGVRVGTPTAERVYFPCPSTTDQRTTLRLTGSTWLVATGSGPVSGYHMAVSATDNRLAVANITWSGDPDPSRVWFSNEGDPETFAAGNYVSITPGDGEQITALASWREYMFALKETKFAVFYGTSTSQSGTPEFNYRMVTAGIGLPRTTLGFGFGSVCVGRPGVFFINSRGVYLTTGDVPRLISAQLDPLFLGRLPETYSGSVINKSYLHKAALTWMNERLYVSVATGSATSNDRLFVWDSIEDQWTVFDIAAAGLVPFRSTNNLEELHFSYATGSNHIGRASSSFTTDDGVAITSRYQSGFYSLDEPGTRAYTRWTRLWGSGAPTVSVLTDHGSTDLNAGAVTLGTAPAVAEGYHLKSYRGQLFSHKFSSTSDAWAVSRLQHDTAFVKR